MAEALSCGSCNLCCRILHIPLMHKPAHMLCEHTSLHGGCKRQSEKATAPELAACEQFECVWLASQTSEGRLPRHLRPNLCHVLLTVDHVRDRYLYAQVDPESPTAWRDLTVVEYLDGALARGWEVEISIGDVHFEYMGSN